MVAEPIYIAPYSPHPRQYLLLLVFFDNSRSTLSSALPTAAQAVRQGPLTKDLLDPVSVLPVIGAGPPWYFVLHSCGSREEGPHTAAQGSWEMQPELKDQAFENDFIWRKESKKQLNHCLRV